ncbi:MAG: hypothetical protein P4L50_13990, partial [Anaerolineaceae bacterium]|nr:hypothetical protein [Anaerolineaceae bacterium]
MQNSMSSFVTLPQIMSQKRARVSTGTIFIARKDTRSISAPWFMNVPSALSRRSVGLFSAILRVGRDNVTKDGLARVCDEAGAADGGQLPVGLCRLLPSSLPLLRPPRLGFFSWHIRLLIAKLYDIIIYSAKRDKGSAQESEFCRQGIVRMGFWGFGVLGFWGFG